MTPEEMKECYPGFKITCKKCGSEKVYIDNNLGFSDMSGSWGSVDIICSECRNRTEIVQG